MLIKAFGRAAAGFAYGALLGQFILIIISLSEGKGSYLPVIPDFRALFETEITAVVVQLVLNGLIGFVFAAASVVFDIEKWSILKQCAVHFLVTAVFWIPIVYLCWMPRQPRAIVICLISFFVTYFITWLSRYLIARKDIRIINEKIKEQFDSGEES